MLTLPPHLLERPAEGYNLPSPPAPLGALLGDRPTLLVFLRHFG